MDVCYAFGMCHVLILPIIYFAALKVLDMHCITDTSNVLAFIQVLALRQVLHVTLTVPSPCQCNGRS